MFGLIDHVGVAVEDLDQALALYEGSLQMPVAHRETVEEQGVEAVLLDVGTTHVELLRPLGPDTAVGKFLARRGPAALGAREGGANAVPGRGARVPRPVRAGGSRRESGVGAPGCAVSTPWSGGRRRCATPAAGVPAARGRRCRGHGDRRSGPRPGARGG